jgi:sugar phosphate isomerase/epimerase
VPRFFYNTNGFAFHRLEDVLRILADLGYDGVALTPDVHHLDPLHASAEDVAAFRDGLQTHGLEVILETGARFVLDPARKHRPSLLDPPDEARVRLAFLESCVDLAAEIGAPVVSVWSGSGPEGQTFEEGMTRLVEGLRPLCDRASRVGVRIGFEPEPGMTVDRAAMWPEVRDRVAHPALGLTLDIGHGIATGEGQPDALVRRHGDDLLVLHIDDHRAGVHDHLRLGEGEVDFAALASAVSDVGFDGPLEVELSRHASEAPDLAGASLGFLRGVFDGGGSVRAP